MSGEVGQASSMPTNTFSPLSTETTTNNIPNSSVGGSKGTGQPAQTTMGTPVITGNTNLPSNQMNPTTMNGSKGTGQPIQTSMGTPIVRGNTYLPQSDMAQNRRTFVNPLGNFTDTSAGD